MLRLNSDSKTVRAINRLNIVTDWDTDTKKRRSESASVPNYLLHPKLIEPVRKLRMGLSHAPIEPKGRGDFTGGYSTVYTSDTPYYGGCKNCGGFGEGVDGMNDGICNNCYNDCGDCGECTRDCNGYKNITKGNVTYYNSTSQVPYDENVYYDVGDVKRVLSYNAASSIPRYDYVRLNLSQINSCSLQLDDEIAWRDDITEKQSRRFNRQKNVCNFMG